MLKKICLLLLLSPLTIAISTDEHTINGYPVKDLLPATSTKKHTFKAAPQDDKDVIVICMNNNNIDLSLKQSTLDYNNCHPEIVFPPKTASPRTISPRSPGSSPRTYSPRAEQISPRLEPAHTLELENITDTGGLFGIDYNNIILKFDQGSFNKTSLAFSETLTLFPYSATTTPLKSITLKKTDGVTRPMLHGIIDWSEQEIFKSLVTSETFFSDGFLIFGCAAYFNYDFNEG